MSKMLQIIFRLLEMKENGEGITRIFDFKLSGVSVMYAMRYFHLEQLIGFDCCLTSHVLKTCFAD